MSIEDIIDSKRLSGFKATPSGHNGGYYVQRLELAFRKYFKVKYAIALNSATAGLHASMIACGIKAGDEVIVSPYSFSSSASCVLMVGAKPVFADIDWDTYCISPEAVAKVITPQTKAIIPVHLFGHPADMNNIMVLAREHNLKVIEDAAQAITATIDGRYVGTIGDCGIFSFNQSKHINTGEGGMLITNDDDIARKVKAVRNHGEVSDPELKILGYNYRMCEIEACLAFDQFRRINSTIRDRIEKALSITRRIGRHGYSPPIQMEGCKHVYYIYAIKGEKRPPGDGWAKGYVEPLYLLPIYNPYKPKPCYLTERIQQQIWVKVL